MSEFRCHTDHNILQHDAEYITFAQFKEWSLDSPKPTKLPTFVDPFGNTDLLPERFEDPRYHYSN